MRIGLHLLLNYVGSQVVKNGALKVLARIDEIRAPLNRHEMIENLFNLIRGEAVSLRGPGEL